MARRYRRKRRRSGKSVVRTVEKLMGIGAFIGPFAGVMIGETGLPIDHRLSKALGYYTGYEWHTNTWDASRLIQGWAPFLAFTVISKGIHKLNGILRRI